MSNPLKRRMAKAALVLAAGAAPVVGAAGQASALPALADSGLTGLTSALDTDSADSAPDASAADTTLQDTTRTANGLVERVGTDLLETTAPIVAPTVDRLAADVAHTTGNVVHDLAMSAAQNGPSPNELKAILPSIDDPDLNGITIP